MQFNIEWVKKIYEEEEHLKYLFFWGHQPRNDGEIRENCLSQWWQDGLTFEGVEYKTAEHWMMAKKAELFNDPAILEKILHAKTPGEAKKLGRMVKGFKQDVWESNRYEIVKAGNLHKFSENQRLKDYLLQTKDRILVEASPYDRIWGIGLTKDHKGVEDPNNWNGLNLLGFALMEVRQALQ